MSRSGYVDYDDCDQWAMIRWQGAVKSAIRGRRGQAFFRELLDALDALPGKRLIKDDLQDESGEVCSLGAVAVARGLDTSYMDSEDHDDMAETFDVARALIKEIEWQNDEGNYCFETPEQRWTRVRAWVARQIKTAVRR